jgi:hypothetical protein
MPAAGWLAFVLLWVIVVIQGFAFLEILRQLSEIRRELELESGPTELPNFATGSMPSNLPEVHSASGSALNLWSRLGRRGTALVFLHPGCVTCHRVAKELPPIAGRQDTDVTVVAIVEARQESEAREFMRQTQLPADLAVVDLNGGVAAAFGINVKPGVVVVSNRATAGAATVRSADQIDEYLAKVLARTGEREPSLAMSVP